MHGIGSIEACFSCPTGDPPLDVTRFPGQSCEALVDRDQHVLLQLHVPLTSKGLHPHGCKMTTNLAPPWKRDVFNGFGIASCVDCRGDGTHAILVEKPCGMSCNSIRLFTHGTIIEGLVG